MTTKEKNDFLEHLSLFRSAWCRDVIFIWIKPETLSTVGDKRRRYDFRFDLIK